MSPQQPTWVANPNAWAWASNIGPGDPLTPEHGQQFADTILANGGTQEDLRRLVATGRAADLDAVDGSADLSGVGEQAEYLHQVAQIDADPSWDWDTESQAEGRWVRSPGLPGHGADVAATEDRLESLVAVAAHRLDRDGLLPEGSESVGLDQSPSQRQQADVREVVTDANAVQTDTGNVTGGDGDSRAARDASLRASTSLTQAHAAAAAPRTTGRASTAAMSQQQRQQLAASATLAAREKVHTDHVREDAEDDLRARDDMRDYPSMDQRSAQRETGRSMGMGR